MAVITYPLNGIEYTAEDAETYLCTRKSGVYSAEDNFALTISGSSSVSVGKGLAWIKDGEFAGKSVLSTEAVLIDVPIADSVLNRKDRIVIQFDKGSNATNIVLKQGTPATAAEAPSIVRDGTIYELGLYVIEIPAANIALNASQITNTMLDENVCGLMRDAVTGIPTASLYTQVEELIAQIRKHLEETIAGNIPPHAESHAKDGTDPITPESIGAASIEYVENAIGSVIGGAY